MKHRKGKAVRKTGDLAIVGRGEQEPLGAYFAEGTQMLLLELVQDARASATNR
jgi:hypothetical protein